MLSLCLCGRENVEKRRVHLLSPHLSHSEYEAIYRPAYKERENEESWYRSAYLIIRTIQLVFSAESVFLLQQFSQNSVFQPSFRPANGAITSTPKG